MAREFICPLCDWKGHPSFDLTAAGKMAAKCGRGTCDYTDPKLTPADFNEGIASTGERVETCVTQAEPARVVAKVPARVAVLAHQPIDIVAAARERAAFLETEIAKAEGYKIELRRLTKFLAAMQPKPAAVAYVDADIQ